MTVELAAREAPDPEERELSTEEEAEEARSLLAIVRDTLNFGRKIPRNWRVHLEKFPTHESARVYEQSRGGEKSVIIESGGGRGEVKFIEADKYAGPRVYAHTSTAVKKAIELLNDFRKSLNLLKPAKKTP